MMKPSKQSRGKAHCKSPMLVHQLSVFFAPARYRVVKIMCSCFEVVLRTIKNYKNTIVYLGSGPCYKVIALHPTFLLLKKMNSVIIGVS
jgi:hypothetical protein